MKKINSTKSTYSKKIAITEKVTMTNNPSNGKPYSFVIAPGMSGESFPIFKEEFKHQIEAAKVELQFEDEIAVEAVGLSSEKAIISDNTKKFMLCFRIKESNWCFALPVRSLYLQTINTALAMYYQNKIDDNKSGGHCEYKIAMFYQEETNSI